jgi:hypothetical protein
MTGLAHPARQVDGILVPSACNESTHSHQILSNYQPLGALEAERLIKATLQDLPPITLPDRADMSPLICGLFRVCARFVPILCPNLMDQRQTPTLAGCSAPGNDQQPTIGLQRCTDNRASFNTK